MYETSAVRDLVWALESPPMFVHEAVVPHDWGLAEIERNPGLLARLDRPKSALQRAVAGRATHRLGEYFEILIATWLDQIPPAQLLRSNLQVHGAGRTVGEFDMIFTRDGFTHHWELAVKYYLGYPDITGPQWIGPDPSDRLQAKWEKMRRKQLALSQHKLGLRALLEVGGSEPVQARAFVKGYLFEALNPRFASRDHPYINPEAPRGFWVHRGDLDAYPPAVPEGTLWLRLGRLRWMSDPVVGDESLLPLSHLIAQDRDDALFVAGFREGADGWEHVARGFVVDDTWPQR